MWQARFPLLLHYLEQHKEKVGLAQWQEWVLALSVNSVRQVEDESFTPDMTRVVTSKRTILDTLSSIFLDSLDRNPKDAKSLVSAAPPTWSWC